MATVHGSEKRVLSVSGMDDHIQRMGRKIKIRKVSSWSIGITVIVAALFLAISVLSAKEFTILHDTTEQYIECERAAKQLQDGSDYLTEQVRLYAMTGQRTYMEQYFKEAETTRRRENALESLKQYFEGTEAFTALKYAMSFSKELMETEYYSIRLEAEGSGMDLSSFPTVIQDTRLSEEDSRLSAEQKREKAVEIVSDRAYQNKRTEITDAVSDCMDDLIRETRNKQGHASTVFSDMYAKLVAGIVVLAVLMLIICLIMRRLVVTPLRCFEKSIEKQELLPLVGASELQELAEVYNQIFQENEETQKLIRHQAEHDALTDLFNRGSFEKLLKIYETGEAPFALILVDVDTFKSVNDTYGHASGDAILKQVADCLRKAFRSIDYVCRIGGDEFAVIMVEMTSNLSYTIEEKITAINEQLTAGEGGLPEVSLSVGAAFTDRENPGESLFKDADKALYYVKEHGRCGCRIYGKEDHA